MNFLYKLRFLNMHQHIDTTKHAIDYRLDPKGMWDLTRSMKDFSRRCKVDKEW